MAQQVDQLRLTVVAEQIIRVWKCGYMADVLVEDGKTTLLEVAESLRFLKRLGVTRKDYC